MSEPAAAEAIRLDRVGKSFTLEDGTRIQALAGISLSIGHGEFVALIGPSGCGKSTVLRLIASLEEPSEGRVTVEGRAPAELARAHRLGVAFQDRALLPWFSVAANVALPFRLAGRAPDAARVASLLALSPDVLPLDEPFGALDAVTRRRLNIELQRIWSEQRITTLLVTHAVEEAIFLADRVVVMSGRPGRIRRTLEVPFARPRGPEVMRTPGFHRLVDELTLALEPEGAA